MAIEGAVQLARCLRDLPTVADAFTGYEGLRRARVQRVIAEAEQNISNKTAPARGVDRDLSDQTLVKPEQRDWLFGYCIDWDAPVIAEVITSVVS